MQHAERGSWEHFRWGLLCAECRISTLGASHFLPRAPAQDCAFWGQHRAPSRLVVAIKAFRVGSTRVAQHGAISAMQYTLCWDLTFVQFEDGVSHGCQHTLSFQDVDIPQPQCEGEGGLFQTHKQKTSSLAPHLLALIDGKMIERLVASLCPLTPKHTTGQGIGCPGFIYNRKTCFIIYGFALKPWVTRQVLKTQP